MKVFLVALAVAVIAAVAWIVTRPSEAATRVETTYEVTTPACRVSDPQLSALSGLATRSGETWVVNDRGAELFRLDGGCDVVETVSLERQLRQRGVTLRDVEDLALGPDGWLWLADTGGNTGSRSSVRLVGWRDNDTPVRVVELTYPSGSYDVEAVLIGLDGRAALVEKTDAGAASVFSTTEALRDGAVLPLLRRGSITLEKPEGSASGSRLVTGGAVSPQSVNVVLRTYTNAWEYDVNDGDLARSLVEGTPRLVPLPESEQGEAVSYASDGSALLATGEGSPVPLDQVLVSRTVVEVP